jgi:hypothetical protein
MIPPSKLWMLQSQLLAAVATTISVEVIGAFFMLLKTLCYLFQVGC